ncbi:helix-turn-helix domain-containing protein [Sodaliphilus sp.]|uniref:helix-turn-helix domain-containing protein n=1 Tax=Sodaliphilus sp. TaxID=2815818 RepID=UPI003890932D
MIKNEPDVAPTARYSIDETCKILGVHRNTLRKYTQIGAIRCGFRRVNSRKFYLGSEIKKLWAAKW